MLTIPYFGSRLPSADSRRVRGIANRHSEAFRAHFYARTEPSAQSDCLLWTGSRFRDGYGQCKLDGKNQRAHRVAWVLERGAIPDGLQILHRCDVPSCVNVSHLFLGTTQDNTADKIAKGRARYTGPKQPARGERSGTARLTDDLVRLMRSDRANGALLYDLVAKYGVPLATVHRAVTRRTWAHVT